MAKIRFSYREWDAIIFFCLSYLRFILEINDQIFEDKEKKVNFLFFLACFNILANKAFHQNKDAEFRGKVQGIKKYLDDNQLLRDSEVKFIIKADKTSVTDTEFVIILDSVRIFLEMYKQQKELNPDEVQELFAKFQVLSPIIRKIIKKTQNLIVIEKLEEILLIYTDLIQVKKY